MVTASISIEVDADAAKTFSEASIEERRKLELLLRFRLRELTSSPGRSLSQIMDDIGTQAEARGLTPEVLELLLHDE